jgi:TonB family protein
VLVSEKGEPLEIRVEQGKSPLKEAAVEAVKQWRFEPGRWKGVAVRTFASVRIPFEAIPFARTPFPDDRTPTRKPAGR